MGSLQAERGKSTRSKSSKKDKSLRSAKGGEATSSSIIIFSLTSTYEKTMRLHNHQYQQQSPLHGCYF